MTTFNNLIDTSVGSYKTCKLCGNVGDEDKCILCGGKMEITPVKGSIIIPQVYSISSSERNMDLDKLIAESSSLKKTTKSEFNKLHKNGDLALVQWIYDKSAEDVLSLIDRSNQRLLTVKSVTRVDTGSQGSTVSVIIYKAKVKKRDYLLVEETVDFSLDSTTSRNDTDISTGLYVVLTEDEKFDLNRSSKIDISLESISKMERIINEALKGK